MDAPDTVTAAIQLLQARGYRSDFVIDEDAVGFHDCGKEHAIGQIVIDYTFRFEGATDPGDEAIVLGIGCSNCGAKGILVSAYGPDADSHLLALINHLSK